MRYFLCLLALFHSALAVTITDDRGQQLQLAQPAKRIISLAPHLTELVFAAGAGKQLIAVSSYSDHPPQALKLPIVANHNSIDIERIIQLQPDLILAWLPGNPKPALQQLERLKIPIYVNSPKQILDIAKTIENIGKLTGTEPQATQRANQFKQHYQQLKQKYNSDKPITAFIQIWPHPLMTMNGKSLLSQAITLCGGKNIFSRLTGIAPQVSREAVIAADPEIIILFDNDKSWEKYPSLNAIRHHHVYRLNPDLLSRFGPRFLQGADELCQFVKEAKSSIVEHARQSTT